MIGADLGCTLGGCDRLSKYPPGRGSIREVNGRFRLGHCFLPPDDRD
jgi:hypothetical protein